MIQCTNWQADSVPYMVPYTMLKFTKHITMSSSKLLKSTAYDGISETLPNEFRCNHVIPTTKIIITITNSTDPN